MRGGFAVLACCAMLIFSSAARAEEPAQIRAARKKAAEQAARAVHIAKLEGSILTELEARAREIEEKAQAAWELRGEIQRLETEIAAAVMRHERRTGEADRIRDRAVARAPAMYRLWRTGPAGALAAGASASSAYLVRERLRWVQKFEAELLADLEAASREARREQGALAAARDRLSGREAALGAEIEAAAVLVEERAALLSGVRRERVAAERLAGEIDAATSKLETEMQRLHGDGPPEAPVEGGFSAQKGRLPWPVSGRVESAFGKKVHPETGALLAQKGIEIRGGPGADVRAVHAGTVVRAEARELMGRVVILKHDGGYLSAYSQLGAFAVKQGQTVQRGTVIGRLRTSDLSGGPVLHFALRGGGFIDPLQWLSKGTQSLR